MSVRQRARHKNNQRTPKKNDYGALSFCRPLPGKPFPSPSVPNLMDPPLAWLAYAEFLRSGAVSGAVRACDQSVCCSASNIAAGSLRPGSGSRAMTVISTDMSRRQRRLDRGRLWGADRGAVGGSWGWVCRTFVRVAFWSFWVVLGVVGEILQTILGLCIQLLVVFWGQLSTNKLDWGQKVWALWMHRHSPQLRHGTHRSGGRQSPIVAGQPEGRLRDRGADTSDRVRVPQSRSGECAPPGFIAGTA